MSNNFKAEKLEIKLFRIGGWVSASGTLFLLIIDSFVFNHHEAAILESVALVAFIIFTYISYHRPSERNMHLFLLMILLVVNLAFFVEEGWATPSAVIFFISILYGTVLVQSKYAKTIVIIFLSNFFALSIIEYFIFPVPKYASETLESTQLLHNIYALLGVVITVLLVNYFKTMYDRERYAINAANSELDFANNELLSKNKSLLEAQKKTREKQELLKANREKLIDTNNQLGQLNKYLD